MLNLKTFGFVLIMKLQSPPGSKPHLSPKATAET